MPGRSGLGTSELGTSRDALVRAYDLAMLDLDGVVYIDGEAVPGAPEHLAAARDQGLRVAFITNNASRPPAAVAAQLCALGVEASASDVVTSAQAAARLLSERYGAGARVVCLGASGLAEALHEQGLVPVGAADAADAVVTGYGPDVVWRDLMRVAVRIRDGLPWVASNTDLTLPTAFGIAPGHGVQVAMLRSFAAVDPVVAGKPARALLDETVRRVGGRRPLMVGDRLDTDIEGARNAGHDSLLVLTGVTDLTTLARAEPQRRPTYLAPDLAGLLAAHPAPVWEGDAAALGGWSARVEDGRLAVRGGGSREDWWRVAAAAGWRHLDETGDAADVSGLEPPAR